jgi:hypothetical protein
MSANTPKKAKPLLSLALTLLFLVSEITVALDAMPRPRPFKFYGWDFSSYLPDTDGDGVHNYLDHDDDNDGVIDKKDAFPLDRLESIDTDGDGIGNNADKDDDNDGFLDYEDAFPLDPKKSKSLAYCGIKTCKKIKGKTICRDDLRCPVSTRETDASKVLPQGADSDRNGIRDDLQHNIQAKYGKNKVRYFKD